MFTPKKQVPISFEFFPTKTPEGEQKLKAVQAQLAQLQPEYFSVTFGAGGSTQQGTFETVQWIRATGCDAAPHLSCIGSTKDSIAQMLRQYKQAGIKRLVALRGDLPSGYGYAGEFRYAQELVEFTRALTGDWFHIEVAAYPEFHSQSRSPGDDLQRFANKVKAGADGAITQFFFNADAYFKFVEDVSKLGVNVPIVPGIMPITNYTQLARFSDRDGIEIPRWMRMRLAAFGDDIESIRTFGLDVITDLCDQLARGGAPGLHLYSMNQATASQTIVQRLRSSP